MFPDIAAELHPTANGDLRPDNIYSGSSMMVMWKCIRRGHEWKAKICNRTGPNRTNCPDCNLNKGEELLLKWASEHPLVRSFTKHRYVMVDPKTNKRRRGMQPDGVLVLENGRTAMVELDGPQHFESVTRYHKKPTDLDDQIRRDYIKNHWARERGMSILRVAYTEFRELESILTTFLHDAMRGQVFRFTNPALYDHGVDA